MLIPFKNCQYNRNTVFYIIVIIGILTCCQYLFSFSLIRKKYQTWIGLGVIAMGELEDNHVLDVIFRTNVKLKSTASLDDIGQFVINNTSTSTSPSPETSPTIITHTQPGNLTPNFCEIIPAGIQGRVTVNLTVLTYLEVEEENKNLQPGGESSPAACKANFNVAIIVPYRDRSDQLVVFLRHLHPFLRKQELHYRIYIVNQADKNKFNRAMLFNVGYREALKDFPWDCFIFHDVDLLPEDDRNLYNCPDNPRHMSVAVDKFKYKLPYKQIFGGVAAIRSDQFNKLNGFSNLFWGWGGEDDDMSKRIRYRKLKIIRYRAEIARYTMIKHKQQPVNKDRAKILRTSIRRYRSDGLNNLKYKLEEKTAVKLYTNLTVQLEHTEYDQKFRVGGPGKKFNTYIHQIQSERKEGIVH